MVSIADFVARVQSISKTGIAGEHAYRPVLHDLLKALGDDLTPVNDAKKSDVGAPDFIILKGDIPIGHLEAKDINLDIRKDRKGRVLSFDDVKHYQRILKILAETDRIMQTITMTLDA
jgi:hypothetical protein